MAGDSGAMERAARQVAARLGIKTGKSKRHLFAVDAAPVERMSALQRDILYSRIRDLTEQYGLGWLLRQETMHVMGIIECLEDSELTDLLAKVEKAVECVHEGVPFAEHGLVRGVTLNWIA